MYKSSDGVVCASISETIDSMICHSVVSVCLYMSSSQGSRGASGQEGVAGLDGEEVD